MKKIHVNIIVFCLAISFRFYSMDNETEGPLRRASFEAGCEGDLQQSITLYSKDVIYQKFADRPGYPYLVEAILKNDKLKEDEIVRKLKERCERKNRVRNRNKYI